MTFKEGCKALFCCKRSYFLALYYEFGKHLRNDLVFFGIKCLFIVKISHFNEFGKGYDKFQHFTGGFFMRRGFVFDFFKLFIQSFFVFGNIINAHRAVAEQG
ncbi:MAG: hypothetical protein ACOX0C_02110 [Patescibacteria group bacterium]